MTVFVEEHDVGDIDDTRLAKRLECLVNDPLDVDCGSPLQVRLYHRCPGETVILVVTHQSVADFWSITAFICELEVLYSELTGGTPSRLPELAAFTRYYSWADGSRVSTQAILDPDESGDFQSYLELRIDSRCARPARTAGHDAMRRAGESYPQAGSSRRG